MKKSEMIQKIAEVLETIIDPRLNPHSEAKYILQIIEEQGMIPPRTKLKLGLEDNAWEDE